MSNISDKEIRKSIKICKKSIEKIFKVPEKSTFNLFNEYQNAEKIYQISLYTFKSIYTGIIYEELKKNTKFKEKHLKFLTLESLYNILKISSLNKDKISDIIIQYMYLIENNFYNKFVEYNFKPENNEDITLKQYGIYKYLFLALEKRLKITTNKASEKINVEIFNKNVEKKAEEKKEIESKLIIENKDGKVTIAKNLKDLF